MTAKKKSPVKSVGAASAHGHKAPRKVMGTVITETDTTHRSI
jgi:hypothetical protein